MSKTVLLSLLVGCMSFGAVQAMDPAFLKPVNDLQQGMLEANIREMIEHHLAQKPATLESHRQFEDELEAHLSACSKAGCQLSMSFRWQSWVLMDLGFLLLSSLQA